MTNEKIVQNAEKAGQEVVLAAHDFERETKFETLKSRPFESTVRKTETMADAIEGNVNEILASAERKIHETDHLL